MTDLVVLALDIAKRRTGWAVGGPTWPRPFWGTFEIEGDYEKQQGKILKAWRTGLINIMTKHSVTYVALERLFVDMKNFDFNGTVPMAQLHGIAVELCEERGIKCGAAAIGAWRSRFLGTGVAPKGMESGLRTKWWKEQAVKACIERNWYVTHHDEAEAIGILDFTLAVFDEDYRHRVGPTVRRMEWKREQEAFRGAGG